MLVFPHPPNHSSSSYLCSSNGRVSRFLHWCLLYDTSPLSLSAMSSLERSNCLRSFKPRIGGGKSLSPVLLSWRYFSLRHLEPRLGGKETVGPRGLCQQSCLFLHKKTSLSHTLTGVSPGPSSLTTINCLYFSSFTGGSNFIISPLAFPSINCLSRSSFESCAARLGNGHMRLEKIWLYPILV